MRRKTIYGQKPQKRCTLKSLPRSRALVLTQEFFTSVRLFNPFDDEDFGFEGDNQSDTDDESPAKPTEPFIIPKRLRTGDPSNSLEHFQNARFPECDQLASKCRQTVNCNRHFSPPNQSFLSLPDASKLSFVDVQSVELPSILPNLPSSILQHDVDTETHMPPEMMSPTPIDLVHRFLVYEPSQRLRPSKALTHPWLTSEPLLMPDDYPTSSTLCNTLITLSWGGKSLGEWLSDVHPQWCDLKE